MTELRTRIRSAAILAPIALAIVWYGGTPFVLMMAACFVIMFREWRTITRSAQNRLSWTIWGAIYIGVPCAMLALFRISTEGKWEENVYLTLIVVWATDIGAYFIGRKFGKHKLAPSISPNKTWEGLIGGMLVAMIAVGLVFTASVASLPFAAFLALMAQAGDLYESWVKRRFGVKDSGNLIPGHGGLLDRMDGILSVAWTLTILWAIVG